MSFDPNLVSPRDRIRHRLGDIYEPPLRQDVEYDALITRYSETEALLLMAESLASEYAQNPSSVSVGGVSVSYSALVSNWQAIAKSAREALDQIGRESSTMVSGIVERAGMNTFDTSEYFRDPAGLDRDGSSW